jgi:hypothetical protein
LDTSTLAPSPKKPKRAQRYIDKNILKPIHDSNTTRNSLLRVSNRTKDLISKLYSKYAKGTEDGSSVSGNIEVSRLLLTSSGGSVFSSFDESELGSILKFGGTFSEDGWVEDASENLTSDLTTDRDNPCAVMIPE